MEGRESIVDLRKLAVAARQFVKEEEYWLKKLSGNPVKSHFPYDTCTDIDAEKAFDNVTFDFSEELYGPLMNLSNKSDTLLYTILVSGLVVLLEKYTGSQDIVVCAPIFKQEVKGDFINTVLTLRNQLDPEMSFKSLLLQVRQTITEATENQAYPVELLPLRLNMQPPENHSPLSDVAILLENIHYREYIEHLSLKMIFSFRRTKRTVSCTLDYDPSLYRRATIERILCYFCCLLLKAITPDRLDSPIWSIAILTDEEKHRLLYDFNHTETAYPKNKAVHQLFAEQAERTPDKPAVVYEDELLSYRLLDEKANQAANYLLVEKHILPGEGVGILMEKSIDLTPVILGILKAGGAYVPINPLFPVERIKNMINDVQIKVVIAQKRYVKVLNKLQWECPSFQTFLCVDSWDIRSEEEIEKNELMSRKLWEYVGDSAADEITGGGWLSSYTGDPIPKKEMDEYGDNILKKLAPLLRRDTRVLEIGCATGISMYRIAPKVELYYGTDLSGVIIEKNKRRIAEEGHRNITLSCLPAHEIDRVRESDFDMVIMNSVIQCFHGHNYLRKVIKKSIKKVGDKGFLFIGDVMDQDLKEELLGELRDFRAAHREKGYRTKTDWSAELFVSKNFFKDLQAEIPEISDIEFTGKIHTVANELTKFRYDVLVTIDKSVEKSGSSRKKRKAVPPFRYQEDLSALVKYSGGELKILPPAGAQSTSLAYIIYTSGSTGRAKGVLVEHRSVVRLVKNTDYIVFRENDRILQTGALEFDASTFEIWGSLLNGLVLYLVPRDTILTPDRLKEAVQRNNITIMWMTSPLFNQMLEADIEVFSGLESLLVGGDVLSCGHINRLKCRYPQLKIINGYGPTENTTFSTTHLIDRLYQEAGESIPVGSPIANSTAYIIDGYGRLQPTGVVGELCVGGDGVARGYLNNPELTAEKFFSNPFMRGDRLYHTGDLARWLPEGKIELLGRMDNQVKIRGFRVEPGEIERRLMTHEVIKEAVVVVINDAGTNGRSEDVEEKQLCAYVVPHFLQKSPALDVSELTQYLSADLPDYMIPSHFIQIDQIPLTTNGKVDLKALPAPELGEVDENFVAPRNEVESKLAEIWSEILRVEKGKIGVNIDFFELGGHSLRATILVSKIHRELHVKVPIAEIFRSPTIAGLSRFIANQKRSIYEEIRPVEKREFYPQSSAQKRLFFLDQFEHIGTSYNMPGVFRVKGGMDKARYEKSFRALIARHESLRTSFGVIGDEPIQRIHKVEELEFAIEYYAAKAGEEVDNIIDNFIRPLDLSKAPLLRIGLVGISTEEHFLMYDMHHIISDGTSMKILPDDFLKLFGGEDLSSLRVQYKDFSIWQKHLFETGQINKQEEYWLNLYSGEIPRLNLPTDYVRPAIQSFEGRNAAFWLDREETRQLKELAAAHDVTLYMVLLAIFEVFLAKVSGQEDVVVGTGVAGRRHSDLLSIIGIFVNTLAIRNYPDLWKTFRQLLKEVKETTLGAFENQEYPFEVLVEKVDIVRDTSRNPLFDVMLVLQNIDVQIDERPETAALSFAPTPAANLDVKPYGYQRRISKFDLTLFVEEINGQLLCYFEYATKLFKLTTIDWFIIFFKEIAAFVVSNPDQKLREIQKISRERKEEIIFQLNNQLREEAKALTGTDDTLQQRLNRSFKKHRYSTVVECGGRVLTYGELERRSNCIASWLINRSVPPETLIGISVEDRLAFISVMIGILKARCVFVPWDAGYPRRRLEVMTGASGVQLIFTDDHACSGQWLDREVEFILSDTDQLLLPGHVESDPSGREVDLSYSPEDSVYIYFTSGTTGTPRAMKGKNRSLLHFIDWEVHTFGIDESFRFSQLTTPLFDAFLRDIFVPLCTGGVICVPGSKEVMLQSGQLIRWLEQSRIHLMHCVPGLFRLLKSQEHLFESSLKELKYILLSGERLNPIDLVGWYDTVGERIQLVNLWGTSETTLAKTFYFVQPSDVHRERIPVGRPLPGARVVVLDDDLEICDLLVGGQLYIKTPFRTVGYHNEPELNAQRFIPDPFSGETEILLHRTGDLGRILADGNIDVIGRDDRQVKIRGIRVELEEIESVCIKHPLVSEVVVVKREISIDNELLCAYLTLDSTTEGEEELLSRVKEYVSGQLPGYMVPSKFLWMEKIPRKPSGKVDYDALPDPLAVKEPDLRLPQDRVEERLLDLWADILGIEKENIGISQSFFELGGNSLNIMALISRIHREFDIRISLKEIFNNITIRHQADIIRTFAVDKYASIKAVEKRDYYPQSSAQKRLFFLDKFDEIGTSYNMSSVFGVRGRVDKTRYEKSFRALIARHESLRTSFHLVRDEPVQRISDTVDFEIEYFDTEDVKHSPACMGGPMGSPAPGRMAPDIIQAFIRPFGLTRAPLFRVGLIKEEDEKYILMFDMHHIITDGTSMGIVAREFMNLYRGEELPPLYIQYKDFSEWHSRETVRASLKKQEVYWLGEFKGEIPVLNLPTDYTRPAVKTFEGKPMPFSLDIEAAGALRELARRQEATMYMVLLTIFNILLSKISGSEDIVVGTGTAGRRHADLQPVIGMFVNTLAMRNYPRGSRAFNEFLGEVKERTLEAFENQDYQFEDLVERLAIPRDTSRNPLFEALFVLQNMEIPTIEIPQLRLLPYNRENNVSKFDIVLHAQEVGQRLMFSLEYSTSLFKIETIERFVGYLKEIVSSVIEMPERKLEELDLISEKEKRQILADFNNTKAEYPEEKVIHQLYEEQAGKSPDSIGVGGMGPGEQQHLTYRELSHKSNQLAHWLHAQGVEPNAVVGIMAGRSVEMIIGLLGILKAGGAYVPIDPDYPQERVQYMLQDSQANILLRQSGLIGGDIFDGISIELDDLFLRPEVNEEAENTSKPADLAYMMYTSGSTARPKGVMVGHRNVIRLVVNTNYVALTGETRILQTGAPVFDATTFEVWGALLNGGGLYLVENEVMLSADRLGQAMVRNKINTLWLTSPLFNQLCRQDCEIFSCLDYLLVGGDVLSPRCINRVRSKNKNLKVINGYGPTENTTFSTTFLVDRDYEAAIPIGRPIHNSTALILDKDDRLQPIGISGQLCVGGDGVSRGYLNSPELTAEKFVDLAAKTREETRSSKNQPLNPESQILYRTGDIARWLMDGNIEFLGRMDNQVKIRGFRIEPAEIENQLVRHDGVREAVVIDRKDERGEPHLYAYVVPSSSNSAALNISELRAYLLQKLPGYMVPSYFVQVGEIPLTTNGKVDRNALLSSKGAVIDLATDYAPLKNKMERQMAGVWKEVLNRDKIGRNDNFFDLGGNSLSVISVINKLKDLYGMKLSVVAMFQYPTVGSLSQYLAGEGRIQKPTGPAGIKEKKMDRSEVRRAAKTSRQKQEFRRRRR